MDLRPVDVAGVVEDVRRGITLRKEAEGLTLTVERENDDLVALADSIRLNQVVGNLVTNAVKYGASGGVVTLRTRRVGRNIRVEVIDKGPGLSVDKQAQLFEPFNRLGLERSAIEGHGIGLTLAKRLTELQGGEIGVISAPGEGATVVVNDVNGDGAQAVVEEVRAAGGEAIAHIGDCSDWETAGTLVSAALGSFGTLDTLVNNAGILRDRMFVNMTFDDWDAVMRVHATGAMQLERTLKRCMSTAMFLERPAMPSLAAP